MNFLNSEAAEGTGLEQAKVLELSLLLDENEATCKVFSSRVAKRRAACGSRSNVATEPVHRGRVQSPEVGHRPLRR